MARAAAASPAAPRRAAATRPRPWSAAQPRVAPAAARAAPRAPVLQSRGRSPWRAGARRGGGPAGSCAAVPRRAPAPPAAGRSFCKAARSTAAASASSPTALSAARRTDALSLSPANPISLSSASSGNASLLSKKPEPRNASASGGADTPVASRAPSTFASCVRSSLIWIPRAAASSWSMPSASRGGSIMPALCQCGHRSVLRFGPRYQRCCGVSWR